MGSVSKMLGIRESSSMPCPNTRKGKHNSRLTGISWLTEFGVKERRRVRAARARGRGELRKQEVDVSVPAKRRDTV